MVSFLRGNKEENALLIDIGNGSISGSLVVFLEKEKPKFIYIIKKFFAVNEIPDASNLEIQMNMLLDETLAVLINKGFENKYWTGKKKSIDKILVSFSSPWFLSKTKAIHLTNEREFVITSKFLNDILKNETELLKNELKTNDAEVTYEVIERSIVHSKINGYTLDTTIGKSTKNFDASLYMSVVEAPFIEKIFQTLHTHTHLGKENILFNTFPLISFTVIRDLFTKEQNFLLMDVTGEVTDLTLVREDIIEKIVTIPSGRNYILRQIAKSLNISLEIADSSLKLYITKKLDETMLLKISDVLIQIEKEWAIYFENGILELCPDMVLPTNLFLTTNEDVAEVYIDFLSLQKTDATINFRKNVKITNINLEKTADFYENLSGFVLDEFAVILSLFYKRILNGSS